MTMDKATVFDKSSLVNAIHGAGFASVEQASFAEAEGYATFDGQCWNWDRDRLREMTIENLQALYNGIVAPPKEIAR